VAFGFEHPFTLAGATAFVVVAATIPASERESRFLDLLLARPLARHQYLLASLLLMVLGAVVLPLALLAGAAIGMPLVELGGKLPWRRYLPCALGLTTLLLAFGGIALLLASGAKRRGPAASQVVGLTLASFVVELLGELWTGLRWVRWASPFHYYKPIQAAIVPSTPWENPAILLAVFAVTTALAFARFSRRDV
jgi:ABC-2 type transport system permease protein